MKRNNKTIIWQSVPKKKKAFCISSSELANAIADYVAKGGKINQVNNPFKSKEN